MAEPWKKFEEGRAPANEGGAKPWEKFAQNDVEVASTGRISEPVLAQAPEESFGKGLLRKSLKALPTVGGIVGGIAGTVAGLPTGPGAVGTGVIGAGIGAAGGEGWKQLGERYFFGENRSSEQAAKDIAGEALSSGAAQAAGNVVGIGGKALANTGVGKAVIGATGRGLSKVGEALTGIPKKAIQTYAKKAPEVAKMSKAAGGDVQAAANTIKGKLNSAIQSAHSKFNSQLSNAIEKASGKSIDPKKIVEALSAERAKLNPKLHTDELGAIDELIGKVAAVTDDTGKIPIKDAHDLKQFLMGRGKSAYNKGGQIFISAKPVSKAAKSGAASARRGFNEAVPEGAAANKGLSVLHGIEDDISKNMLKEDATASGLLSAGSGANPKNIKDLNRLNVVTGYDGLADAEKLYAMKAFDDAPVLPWDFTGKAAGRMALGAGAGYAADGQEGAIAGAALTSPLMLKGLIRSGRGLLNVAGSAPGKQAIGAGLINQIQEYINKRRAQGATDEQIEQEIGAME